MSTRQKITSLAIALLCSFGAVSNAHAAQVFSVTNACAVGTPDFGTYMHTDPANGGIKFVGFRFHDSSTSWQAGTWYVSAGGLGQNGGPTSPQGDVFTAYIWDNTTSSLIATSNNTVTDASIPHAAYTTLQFNFNQQVLNNTDSYAVYLTTSTFAGTDETISFCSQDTVSSSIQNFNQGFTATDVHNFTYVHNGWGMQGTSFYSDVQPLPQVSGNTQFIQPYTPANGSYSSSTPTTFSYQYFFNDTQSFGVYDTVGIDIRDVTNANNTPNPATSSIGVSGTATYTANVTLTAGDEYLWRPIMYSSAGTSTPLYGDWYSFLSTSTPAWDAYTPYTPPATTLSTSTNPIPTAPCSITDPSGCFQNAISYLFYPTVNFSTAFATINVQNKAPFVYAYQINQMRQDLLSASSTAPTSITVSLWKLPNQATTTITLISKGMIANVPYSGTIYDVLTFLIWLGMAEYVYYRVTHMHDASTPK